MKRNKSFLRPFLFLLLGLALFSSLANDPCPSVAYTDNSSPVPRAVHADYSVNLVQGSTDTVRNPYAPPLRYGTEDVYKQLGYLKLGTTRLPFMGKPCHVRRDKWYYYTTMDSIKIPVVIQKRKCSIAPGCDSVSSGDPVMVDKEEWIVELYDVDMV